MTNWGTAVVVDPRVFEGLRTDVERLRLTRHRLLICACLLAAFSALLIPVLWRLKARTAQLSQDYAVLKDQFAKATMALETMTDSHRRILAATEVSPSVGTKSWGRQFEVTQYIPRSPDYGKFNDGFTSTMRKADPKARIVAVDPKLIPYHSKVWIEGLGWFNAEDCGSAIKGFRLDVLAANTEEARAFGRQKRFVIVVPPGAEKETGTGTTAMLPSPAKDAGNEKERLG